MLVTIDNRIYNDDIANYVTCESASSSDDYEYEDSFINDDEPEPLSPSPVSSIGGMLVIVMPLK